MRRVRRALLPAGLAALGGALLAGGHPPVGLAAAGWVALVPLLALARVLRGRPGQAAAWGLVAGLVCYLPLLTWVERFATAAWVGLALLPSAALAAFMAGLAWWGDRRGRAVVAVAWWVALEALRSSWPFGGFAWGVLGYTQHDLAFLRDAARTVGVLGVSALCAGIGAAIEEAAARLLRRSERTAEAAFARIRTPLGALLGLLVAAVLLRGTPPAPSGRTVDVAAVQADDVAFTSAAGVTREDVGRIRSVAEEMLEATRPLADDPPELTVWPENSVDADLDDPDLAPIVAAALDLLGGGPMLITHIGDGPRPDTVRNQMTVVTAGGIGESYDKRHPVPFGEYVPWRPLLGDLPLLRAIPSDMVPGSAAVVLEVAGARVGGVICFENTYPELVAEQVRAGADLLVVSTNNTSFRGSAMSAQHLAFSRLRAIESGRWVLHAGLSGISAVIAPDGTVTQTTQQLTDAIVRADLPLVEGLTPAMRVAGWVGPLAGLVSALAALALVLRRYAFAAFPYRRR